MRDHLDSDISLRVEALQLAGCDANECDSPSEVVARAEVYLAFLRGEKAAAISAQIVVDAALLAGGFINPDAAAVYKRLIYRGVILAPAERWALSIKGSPTGAEQVYVDGGADRAPVILADMIADKWKEIRCIMLAPPTGVESSVFECGELIMRKCYGPARTSRLDILFMPLKSRADA